MKRMILLCVAVVAYIHASAQDLQTLESKRVKLPNGWSITPAGRHLAVAQQKGIVHQWLGCQQNSGVRYLETYDDR